VPIQWPGRAAGRPAHLKKRVGWARFAVLLALALFAARTAQLTLVQGKDLAEQARSNVLLRRRLVGPRGSIYDAYGNPLAVNVRTYTLEIARLRNSPDEIRRTVTTLEVLLGRRFDGVADKAINAPDRWKRVTVCSGLTLDEITPVLERRPTLFGLLPIEEVDHREYALGPAAAPVVGYTSDLWVGEVEEARKKGLPRDARIGRVGLERFYDDELRGKQGMEIVERDARGRRRRLLSQEPGLPGCDLFTTLDSNLQQTAYALLDGRKGCVLAMDPWTGEILALAVAPSFDPSAPGAASAPGEEKSYLNRAVMQHYPPGSPFKIVTALSGLLHDHSARELHQCDGQVYLDSWPGRPFYCDNRAGHGLIGLSEALMVSCNVYFYELAAELGPDALLDTAGLLELDRPTGIDLPGEVPGTLRRLNPADVDEVQEILLGIGQGPLDLTPVQVLRLTAAVATRGRLVTPHLVKAMIGPSVEEIQLPTRPVETVDVPSEVWETIALGLNRVVNEEGGTAYRAAFPPSWDVCGKTGTAQRPPGEPDAWFVGFAPWHHPEIAFVVLLEHAGHGGDEAAPVARELLAAWFDRDLPSPKPTPPPPTTAESESRPVPGGGEEPAAGKKSESSARSVQADPSDQLDPTDRSDSSNTHAGGASHPQDHPTTRSSPSMSPHTTRSASDYDWVRGAVVRGPRDKKQIALVFTGGDFGEGTTTILDTLRQRHIRGAFFFTGDYLRKPEHRAGIQRLLAEGHYLGPHSDKHLLYCPWDDRGKTLVTRSEFEADLKKNVDDLVALGARRDEITWWIPPYEWYNEDITDWSLAMGMRLFNFTPGTLSHADYTEDDAENYRDCDTIYRSILDYESSHDDGLNGFLLLTHVGASPKRTDKFFTRLPALLDELKGRGYTFMRLDQLLDRAPKRDNAQ